METFVALLRGINVSGQKIIKMDDLKKLLTHIGFINVRTYIQSGNIVFESSEQQADLIEHTIAAAITGQYGFDVPVLVLRASDLVNIAGSNPLANEDKDEKYLHVTFFREKPADFRKDKFSEKLSEGEIIEFSDEAVYLYCPKGYGITKLSNNFIENTLKVQATTRNWKTVQELINLVKK